MTPGHPSATHKAQVHFGRRQTRHLELAYDPVLGVIAAEVEQASSHGVPQQVLERGAGADLVFQPLMDIGKCLVRDQKAVVFVVDRKAIRSGLDRGSQTPFCLAMAERRLGQIAVSLYAIGDVALNCDKPAGTASGVEEWRNLQIEPDRIAVFRMPLKLGLDRLAPSQGLQDGTGLRAPCRMGLEDFPRLPRRDFISGISPRAWQRLHSPKSERRQRPL